MGILQAKYDVEVVKCGSGGFSPLVAGFEFMLSFEWCITLEVCDRLPLEWFF